MNKWTRPYESGHASAEPTGARPAPAAHHYFAFLSYSHADSADADWLHQELEKFRVPRSLAGRLTANGVIPKRLSPIFRDRHELAASDDLGGEIRQALQLSRCLIVLCSPQAAKSKWTNAEIEVFKKAHPDGCIIAAIVAGDPGAAGEDCCFPPALLQKYDRLGRPTGKSAEPLAADLRDSGDGRRMGLLKIVAGILGVGLDDLVQRDHLRRQRRLGLIAAASLGGMVVTSGLAVTAIEARDAARDQRRQAESLVEFMLGDLKDKLEPIGRLDALDGVGSRVLAYYSKQNTSDLSDEALAQRSRALTLMGQIADDRGNLERASAFFRSAIAGTAELVRRSPEDPQRLFDHAQNVFYLGDLARREGRANEAESSYREYKSLADRMVAIDPNNLRWRMESAYGDVNMGIAFRGQRRFDDAVTEFKSALATMESVASIDRKNGEYQEGLANLLGWLADAERDQGDLDSATRIRERQVDFLNKLLETDSANASYRERLIPAHQGLAILLRWHGKLDQALEQLQLGVKQADSLLSIEPQNILWSGYGAQARLELARTLLSSGNRSEAESAVNAGCRLSARVLAKDPGPNWHDLQTTCLTLQSRLALASNDIPTASRLAEKAVASANTQQSADPIADRYQTAGALRLLGDVRRRSGDLGGAEKAWTVALSSLPRNVRERPQEMSVHAELLARVGRTADARPLKARLDAMGFSETN